MGEIHCKKVKIEPHDKIPHKKNPKWNKQTNKFKSTDGELYTSPFQQDENTVKSIKFGFFLV